MTVVVRSFISEKEQLDREKQETLAKLLRLESQSRSLEERVRRAMSRELRDISELEGEEASSVPAPSSTADAPAVNSSGADPLPFDPSWVQKFVLRPGPFSVFVFFAADRTLAFLWTTPSSPGLIFLRNSLWSIRVPLVELLKFLGAVEICSWLP